MFRLLQVLIFLMIIPVVCLGFMVGLSGGGSNPAYQRIGQWLLIAAPLVGVAGLVMSFILNRMEQIQLAYAALVIPVVVWVGLLIWLQRETQFFTW